MKIKTPIGTLDCQESKVGFNTSKAGVQRLFHGQGKNGGLYSISLLVDSKLVVMRVSGINPTTHKFSLGQYSIEETIETVKEIA